MDQHSSPELDRRRPWRSFFNVSGQSEAYPFLNVLASGLRAGIRAAWSLFAPLMLPVQSFGIYSLFQATVTMVSQIAILGTRQAILREPTRELPFLGLFLHSLSIAAVALLLFGMINSQHGWLLYALVTAGSISMIMYLQLSARTKSRLQFGHALRSEAIGSVVLVGAMLAIGLAAVTHRRGLVAYPVIAGVEILATSLIVASLMSGQMGRLSPRERNIDGTRGHLSSVYSLGVVVLFDVVLFQRLELFFLQRSPDGMEGVAAFGLAAQLLNVFRLIPTAVVEAWNPTFARSLSSSPSDFFRDVQDKLQVYRRLYIALVIASVCATPLLIHVVFMKYSNWTWPITALVGIRLICGYFGFYFAALYASRRERLLYAPLAIGTVVALIANSLFTLRWGVSGAILAVITEFCG